MSIHDQLKGMRLYAPFNKAYAITSRFGDPRTYKGKRHEGIDFDITTSNVDDSKEPVIAMRKGVVTRIERARGAYYNYIIIRCQYKNVEFDMWYAHLDDIYVKVGEEIKRGQAIGELGGTGGSWREHVHVNLQIVGVNINMDLVVPRCIDFERYIVKSHAPTNGEDKLGVTDPPVNTGEKIDVWAYLCGKVNDQGYTQPYGLVLYDDQGVPLDVRRQQNYLVGNTLYMSDDVIQFKNVIQAYYRKYELIDDFIYLQRDTRIVVSRVSGITHYCDYKYNGELSAYCPRYVGDNSVYHSEIAHKRQYVNRASNVPLYGAPTGQAFWHLRFDLIGHDNDQLMTTNVQTRQSRVYDQNIGLIGVGSYVYDAAIDVGEHTQYPEWITDYNHGWTTNR